MQVVQSSLKIWILDKRRLFIFSNYLLILFAPPSHYHWWVLAVKLSTKNSSNLSLVACWCMSVMVHTGIVLFGFFLSFQAFKTRMLGRMFHAVIKGVSYFTPIVGSHNEFSSLHFSLWNLILVSFWTMLVFSFMIKRKLRGKPNFQKKFLLHFFLFFSRLDFVHFSF